MGVLKIASRNIWRRKARTFLVVLALGFSIAILVAIPASTQTYSDQVEAALEAQRSAYQGTLTMIATEIIVGPPQPTAEEFGAGRMFWMLGFIDEKIAENIALIPGVDAVCPQFQRSLLLPTTEGQEVTENRWIRRRFMTVVGIPLDPLIDEKYGIQPRNIVSGRKLMENDNLAILLGISLAENYFKVGVGQSVDLGGFSFLVVGIFDAGDSRANRSAYMSLHDAQMLFDQPGEVSRIRVFAKSIEDVDSIANEIESIYGDNVSVTTQADLLQRVSQLFQETEEAVTSQLARMESVARQEILIAIIAGGLIVFFTMIYAVRERTKEIGILKALGFTNRKIVSQFVLEGAMIGLVGGLVGVIIGSFGAPLLSNTLLPHVSLPTGFGERFVGRFGLSSQPLTVQATPGANLILLGLAAAILLGAVGSLYPSWWASRKSPAEALRYE